MDRINALYRAIQPKGLRGRALAIIGALTAFYGLAYINFLDENKVINGLQVLLKFISLDTLGVVWLLVGVFMLACSGFGGWHRIALISYVAINSIFAGSYLVMTFHEMVLTGHSSLWTEVCGHLVIMIFTILFSAMHEPRTLKAAAELPPIRQD